MEQIEDLKQKLAKFVEYCILAEKAESFAEVDEAKVKGLIAFNELLRQVNRAQVVLLNATRDRRAVLVQKSYSSVRQVIKKAGEANQVSSANEVATTSETTTPTSTPVEKPKTKTAKSKSTKKASK